MTGISIRGIGLLMAAMAALTAGPAGAEGRAYQTVGRKLTAIPLVNFSSDDGAGYGLRASLFDYDGESIPYRRAASVQAFFSTKGKWTHRVYMDIPDVRPGQRLEIEALYEKEDYANYSGGLTDEALSALGLEADLWADRTRLFAETGLYLFWHWKEWLAEVKRIDLATATIAVGLRFRP